MLVEIVLLTIAVIFWWYYHDRRKYEGFPPGPARFPVLGNIPYLSMKSPDPVQAFMESAKAYGDIIFLKIGQLDAVIFSSYDSIVEILKHDKAASRAGTRIPVIKDRLMNKNIGLLWSNDDVWSTIRRFTLRTLRDFGFGKQLSMDAVINDELKKLLNHIDSLILKNNGVVQFDGFFDLTIINILWRLVTGVSYTLDNPRMNYLLQISNEQVRNGSFGADLSIAFPVLRDWFPFAFAKTKQSQIISDLRQFSHETIVEHRSSGTFSTDAKGFVDIFLQKIQHENEIPNTHFTDENLNMTILDLFQAGAETTSKTLAFGVLYMLLNPQIQDQVHQEIASIVTNDEPITTSFKSQLVFSYATLLEILRYSSVVPLPPMRQASEDFVFRGYTIKKGTALMPNVYASHFDVRDWQDPHTFRPQRFLLEDGTIDQHSEAHVIPFGGGKRLCVGKTLAEASLFIYFTELVRRYKFEKVPNKPEPSVTPVPGMTYSPQPFDVKIVLRRQS